MKRPAWITGSGFGLCLLLLALVGWAEGPPTPPAAAAEAALGNDTAADWETREEIFAAYLAERRAVEREDAEEEEAEEASVADEEPAEFDVEEAFKELAGGEPGSMPGGDVDPHAMTVGSCRAGQAFERRTWVDGDPDFVPPIGYWRIDCGETIWLPAGNIECRPKQFKSCKKEKTYRVPLAAQEDYQLCAWKSRSTSRNGRTTGPDLIAASDRDFKLQVTAESGEARSWIEHKVQMKLIRRDVAKGPGPGESCKMKVADSLGMCWVINTLGTDHPQELRACVQQARDGMAVDSCRREYGGLVVSECVYTAGRCAQIALNYPRSLGYEAGLFKDHKVCR